MLVVVVVGCFLFDGMCCVWVARPGWSVRGCAPSQTSTARAWPPQRYNVGVACLPVTTWWSLTCAGASDEHGEPFQPPWAWSHATVLVSLVAPVSACSRRWVRVAACALCGVRRRLSASRRHLTAHGWCCCDAFGLTALAAYAGRAARLGQICGCAPFQMTSAGEWPPIRRRRLSA